MAKVHADAAGCVVLLLSEGQMSVFKGAALMFDRFPPVSALMADKGYYADRFREALQQRGIKP
jgi:putative transposase